MKITLKRKENNVNQLICSLPLLIFSILLLFFIQFADRWKFCTFITPLTQRTLFDFDHPKHVVDLQDQHDLEQKDKGNEVTENAGSKTEKQNHNIRLSSVSNVIELYDLPL